MNFANKEFNKRIESFLDCACSDGMVDPLKREKLKKLLREREPSDWGAVLEALRRQGTRFSSWLGMTRRTTEKGAAGSVDNLLVLINSFVFLFAAAALAPVFYIYRGTTWIVPVVLFCPLVHFLAFRLARNPAVSPSRAKWMHLFAATVSVVPLLCLAFFGADAAGVSWSADSLAAAALVLWTAHLILTASLIRTSEGFYCALVLSDIVACMGLWRYGRDLAGVICLQFLLAAFQYCLAGRARNGKCGMPPAGLHMSAGFFLSFALAGLGIFVGAAALDIVARGMTAPILYAASLALLPIAVRSEAARLSGARPWVRNGWRALLAATWLFSGAALLVRGSHGAGGLVMRAGAERWALLAVLSAMVFAWALLLLHEQFLAVDDFNLGVFVFASVLLLVCLAAGYEAMARHVAHLPALLLASGVFAATLRLRRHYAAVLPPRGKTTPASRAREGRRPSHDDQ